MQPTDFPTERRRFAELRPQLLDEHEGEYVLIIGDELIDVKPRLEELLKIGLERVGGPEFFTARVTARERVLLPAALMRTV